MRKIFSCYACVDNTHYLILFFVFLCAGFSDVCAMQNRTGENRRWASESDLTAFKKKVVQNAAVIKDLEQYQKSMREGLNQSYWDLKEKEQERDAEVKKLSSLVAFLMQKAEQQETKIEVLETENRFLKEEVFELRKYVNGELKINQQVRVVMAELRKNKKDIKKK